MFVFNSLLAASNRGVDDGFDRAFEIDEVGAIAIDDLHLRLRALFRDPRYRPPTPPTVALELLALSHQGDADFDDVAGLFMQDPLLATRVLRLARSPLFGAHQVPTLRDAVVRLGMRRLAHVVFEAALEMRVFRSVVYAPWMERVRRHSIAVAHAAALVADTVGLDRDRVFVAGLVHDVGIAAAIAAVGDRGGEFADIDAVALAAALQVIHLEVGAMIADVWQLSPDLKAIVSAHHNVVARDPTIAVVVAAEAIAIDAGFDGGTGHAPSDLDPFVADDLVEARAALGLEIDDLSGLSRTLTTLLARRGLRR